MTATKQINSSSSSNKKAKGTQRVYAAVAAAAVVASEIAWEADDKAITLFLFLLFPSLLLLLQELGCCSHARESLLPLLRSLCNPIILLTCLSPSLEQRVAQGLTQERGKGIIYISNDHDEDDYEASLTPDLF